MVLPEWQVGQPAFPKMSLVAAVIFSRLLATDDGTVTLIVPPVLEP